MTSTPPDSGPDATPEFDESNRAVFGRICSYVYPNDRIDVWGVRENGRFVGHAEIKHTTDIDGFEIIYALARHAWGRGLGTELTTRLSRDWVAACAAAERADRALYRQASWYRPDTDR